MEQTPKIISLPSFFKLAKESIEVYQRKWRTLLKIVFASYLIYSVTIFCGLFAILSLGKLFSFWAYGNWAWIMATAGAIFFLSAAFILSSWFSAATIIVLRDWQEDIGLRESLRRAKPYVIQFFLTNALTALLVAAGFLFFVFPGILLLTWFLFPGYVIFFGDERGIDTLFKSINYVRGFFWSILARLLLLLAAIIFISSIFKSIELLPLGKLIHSVVSAAASPLITIYLYLIFNHLRKIKGDSLPVSKSAQKNNRLVLIALSVAAIVICGLLFYASPQIKNFYDLEIKKIDTQSGINLLKMQ